MSAKEFDELIKNSLGQPDFVYSPEDYRVMNTQLIAARRAKTSRKMLFVLTGIAASLALIVTISALSHRTAYDKGEHFAKEIKTKSATIPQVGNASANTMQNIKVSMKNIGQNESFIRHLNNSKTTKFRSAQPFVSNNIIFGTTNNEPVEKNTPTSQQPGNSLPLDIQPVGNEAILLSTISKHPLQTMSGGSDLEPFIREFIKPDRKMNISLTGGLNYGSASQGYLLGASFRKSLGNKLYIEGDVAYTNSSSQRTVNTYSTAPPFTSNFNSAQPPVAISKENVNSLNYLQLSPGVGYHIHKKIAVGLGADFQRLLQSNVLTTSSTTFTNGTASETGKIIPDIDYGIIGKTEYSVSSRLKAGLQYREGLNNFLANSNKYFDRNYFQVQIKYSLFNK